MKKLLILLLTLTLLPLPCLAEEAPTVLKIAGFISEHELSDFMRDNPDIQAESVTDDLGYMYDAGLLIQALTTRDATYDVLVTNTETINLPSVMEKGYAVALDTPALLEAYQGMYPFLREAVSHDGVCYGLPLALLSGTPSYDPSAFEATGLTPPTSWQELAALINDFPNQPDEVREEYELFMWALDYRSKYFNLMMDAYATHRQATGQELCFDTPLFRELMALTEQLTDENDVEEEREVTPLMQNLDVLECGYTGQEGLLLPLEMDGHISIGASVYVAIINPYSQHIPEALRLLEYLAAHYDPAVRLTIMEEGNVPTVYETYEARIADWEAEKARLEQVLADADPADARTARDALEQHLLSLEGIERWEHWALSPEAIAAWQAVAPYMVITGQSIFQYADASGQYPADVLKRRYLDGELPVEQFIRQLDEKCRMMIMERQ